MLTHPSADGQFDGDDPCPGEVRVLSLTGGPQMFLDWGGEQISNVVGGAATPRILRAQEVVQSDIWLKNGFLRPLRASHLTWSHSSEAGQCGFTASLLLLPN